MSFLDILMLHNKTNIWVILYHKHTITQGYLTFVSSHLYYCISNIPFLLAWRIRTTAEINTKQLENLENLKSNYPGLFQNNYQNLQIKRTTIYPAARLMKTKQDFKWKHPVIHYDTELKQPKQSFHY